jgi:hypothetical protein
MSPDPPISQAASFRNWSRSVRAFTLRKNFARIAEPKLTPLQRSDLLRRLAEGQETRAELAPALQCAPKHDFTARSL